MVRYGYLRLPYILESLSQPESPDLDEFSIGSTYILHHNDILVSSLEALYGIIHVYRSAAHWAHTNDSASLPWQEVRLTNGVRRILHNYSKRYIGVSREFDRNGSPVIVSIQQE